MSIANIAGQVVRGDNFFPRPREVEQLWKALHWGGNIQLAAPRRVGKTSLVEFLRENPRERYHLLYITVESANNEEDFFQRLYRALFDETAPHFVQFTEATKSLLARIRKLAISGAGTIEMGENPTQWYERLMRYLAKMVQAQDFGDTSIVLVLDEFPQVIENIRKAQGDDAAVHFLQKNRELRHTPAFAGKVQFLYTGSIGLEQVVGLLGASRTINDLKKVTVRPMTEDEATAMIREIVAHPAYGLPPTMFSDECVAYIIHRIRWLVPFYIQLLLAKLAEETDEAVTVLEPAVIDTAFTAMLTDRSCFGHWQERLRTAFKQEEYRYTVEVLNKLSEEGATLDRNRLYDIGIQYQLEDTHKHKWIVSVLEADGYIVEEDGRIRFNSPVVQAWWRNNVAR